MTLLLFGLKVLAKRTLFLFKASPVIVIGAAFLIAVFAVAQKYVSITFDARNLMLAVPFLALYSLLRSLKKRPVMPELLIYSKSKLQNKMIYAGFFAKQAFVNNILLLIFNIIVFNRITLIITASSLILSFVVILLKNNYANRKISKPALKKPALNPLIKSALHDYITPDFLSVALLPTAWFLFVAVEFAKDKNFLYALNSPAAFFVVTTIILSVGFMGIIESIPNINWKFQAIISPNSFTYHLKRIMLFLGAIFGPAVIFFMCMAPLKYLYCTAALFLASAGVAFTFGNTIIKAAVLLLITAFTAWISALHAGFLPIVLIPVFAALAKAKIDYREWSSW